MMNVWFVIPQYEDGVWISQDGDSDVGYASEELALRAKELFDAADREAHHRREAQRFARSSLYREARAILDTNGFEDVDRVLPPGAAESEERNFESRYNIIAIEIKE